MRLGKSGLGRGGRKVPLHFLYEILHGGANLDGAWFGRLGELRSDLTGYGAARLGRGGRKVPLHLFYKIGPGAIRAAFGTEGRGVMRCG